MAAIERGQGAPDEVVRGWLAKALGASRGPQWICGNCTHIHAAWVPVCENCGAFDTLDWKTPAHAEDAGLADSAMLPLIIGAEPAPPEPAARPQARPAPPQPRLRTPSWPASPTGPGRGAPDRRDRRRVNPML